MRKKKTAVGLLVTGTFLVLIGIFAASCKQADTPSAHNSGSTQVPGSQENECTVIFAPAQHGKLTAKIKDGAEIQSGKKVPKGTTVIFTAEPEKDFTIEKWTGELAATGTQERTVQLVVTKDVTVGVIFKSKTTQTPGSQENECTVTLTPPEYGVLEAHFENGTDIASGTKVKKGTVVIFRALSKNGFHIKEWKGIPNITDAKAEIQKVTVESDITVAVVFEAYPIPAGKMRIIFGHSITCINIGISPSSYIVSGSDVAEDANLQFTSSAEVEEWFINGMSKSHSKEFNYKLQKADAQNRIITVTYKEKVIPVIEFDSGKVQVSKLDPPNNPSIQTGTKVPYHTGLLLTVVPSAGKTVDKWTINGVDKTNKFKHERTNCYRYTVDAEDVKDRKLAFKFTEKTSTMGTITFNADKIAVYKNDGTKQEEIMSGTAICEGQALSFLSKLPVGTVVEKWNINGTAIPDNLDKQYIVSYSVKAGDFASSVMAVTINERSAAHGKIKLGEGVTCTKSNFVTSTVTQLNTGDAVQETDYLEVVSSKGGRGTWKINDKEYEGVFPPVSTGSFLVKKEYFSGDTLKIEFIRK